MTPSPTCRTRELEDNGGRRSTYLIQPGYHGNLNITLEKCILLYFHTHFNLLDLCLWLRGDIVLDLRMVGISCNSLQQVARDNFVILQTLKICLVEASWVFTKSRKTWSGNLTNVFVLSFCSCLC